MTSRKYPINVDAMPWRYIDVEVTLFKLHMLRMEQWMGISPHFACHIQTDYLLNQTGSKLHAQA